tara:strand:- start:915 stop:1595 length:681 start_codon:yes stop_codon:yes gene_type:complete
MSFKKNRYIVIKEAISKDMAIFIYNYFLMKKQVYDTCLKQRFISPYEILLGEYEPTDGQIPNTYSSYSDIVMETLLLKCQPIMEKTTGLKLQPAYTYARLYKKGDILKRHKDRFSCEVSTTMNLGGDPWSIFLNPNPKAGHVYGKYRGIHQVQNYMPTKDKGLKVDLNPGDMLIYSGCELEHWREKFKGKSCGQVFLHYNNKKTKGSKQNLFDKRPHLGLPAWFKK